MGQLVNGLGGEEVQFSGLSTLYSQGYMSPYWVGSVTAAGGLNDGNGNVISSSIGSPTSFGAKIQAGTAGPLLAATGSIVFGKNFAGSNFVVTITPQVSGTLYPYVVSGTTTYTISGITFGAQSGLSYNWIAVGI